MQFIPGSRTMRATCKIYYAHRTVEKTIPRPGCADALAAPDLQRHYIRDLEDAAACNVAQRP